jgi:hypothetical protein
MIFHLHSYIHVMYMLLFALIIDRGIEMPWIHPLCWVYWLSMINISNEYEIGEVI